MATNIDVGLYDELHQQLKTNDLTEFYARFYKALQQHYWFMLQIAGRTALLPVDEYFTFLGRQFHDISVAGRNASSGVS